MTKPKRRKRAEPSAPPPGGNEEKKPVQEECRNSVASVRKVSRKPPEKPSENPRIQANNMTIVDVALAAAQRNRDDRMKARAMLKNARLLISKGRLNRWGNQSRSASSRTVFVYSEMTESDGVRTPCTMFLSVAFVPVEANHDSPLRVDERDGLSAEFLTAAREGHLKGVAGWVSALRCVFHEKACGHEPNTKTPLSKHEQVKQGKQTEALHPLAGDRSRCSSPISRLMHSHRENNHWVLSPTTHPHGMQFDASALSGTFRHLPRPSAHTVLCEAIVFGGAPNLLVVLHELRARVRTCLNMWADAREDVQVALRGLEQGEGDEAHDMDSEEERMEVGARCTNIRWRSCFCSCLEPLFRTISG